MRQVYYPLHSSVVYTTYSVSVQASESPTVGNTGGCYKHIASYIVHFIIKFLKVTSQNLLSLTTTLTAID